MHIILIGRLRCIVVVLEDLNVSHSRTRLLFFVSQQRSHESQSTYRTKTKRRVVAMTISTSTRIEKAYTEYDQSQGQSYDINRSYAYRVIMSNNLHQVHLHRRNKETVDPTLSELTTLTIISRRNVVLIFQKSVFVYAKIKFDIHAIIFTRFVYRLYKRNV